MPLRALYMPSHTYPNIGFSSESQILNKHINSTTILTMIKQLFQNLSPKMTFHFLYFWQFQKFFIIKTNNQSLQLDLWSHKLLNAIKIVAKQIAQGKLSLSNLSLS